MPCFVPVRSRSEVSCVHPQRSVHTSCFPESPHVKVLLPARQLWDHWLLIRGHYGERRLSFNQLTANILLLFYSTILLKSVINYSKKKMMIVLHLWFSSTSFLYFSMCWNPHSPSSTSLVWISRESCTEPTMAQHICLELWVSITLRPMTMLMWFCR